MSGETCRVCGCTDEDCSQCVEKTGVPCSWIELDLCSACANEPSDFRGDYTWKYVQDFRALAKRMGTLDEPSVRRRLRKMEQSARKRYGDEPTEAA